MNAYESEPYNNYLQNWIEQNLKNPMARRDYPYLLDWRQQASGSFTFNWREYTTIPRDPKAPVTIDVAPLGDDGKPVTVTPLRPPHKTGALKQPATCPPEIKQAIVAAAQKHGVPHNLALAVSQRESSFNPRAKNPESTATGLFQLLKGTARQYGVSDPTDPVQNANGGTAYIAYLLNRYNGDTTKALTGFTAGEGNVDKLGVEGAWAKYPWIPGWLADVQNIQAKLDGFDAMQPQQVQSASVKTSPFAEAKARQNNAAPDATDDMVDQMTALGWVADYRTDNAHFLYSPDSLHLCDEEHECGFGHQHPNPERLYATQMSVVFVNNLPQLPLSSFEYPTYQHIGPAGTMISISLMSDGDMSQNDEPQHPGLARLMGAVSMLENQYHRMKGEWRSVASLHRMQAVVIENQVLNLLGIYGVIPQGVHTTTLPDSANLVQASFTCTQYENIFEQLHPYVVKGTAEYDRIWKEQIFDGDGLDKFAKDDPMVQPLRDYAQHRKARDYGPLFEYLSQEPKAQMAPISISLGAADVEVLKSGQDWLTSSYPDVAGRVKSNSQINFNDFVLLAYQPDAERIPGMLETRNRLSRKIDLAAAQGSPDSVDLLYDGYLQWLVRNDRRASNAVQRLTMTSGFQQELMKGVDTKTPEGADFALEHCCYKDLGLKRLDDSPGGYFYDYAAGFRREMGGYLEKSAQAVTNTVDYFNKVTGTTKLDLQSSDAAVFSGAKARGLSQAEQDAETTGRVSSIMEKTVIPFNSMNRAFPTFKLLLAEEDNLSKFYMFDDFYSYSSVLSVEVIRYQDKPDTAVIQLSNLTNLLSHKLYDKSIEGKFDFEKDPRPEIGESDDGSAIQAPISGRGVAEKTRGRFGRDLTAGFDKSGKQMPLQYFPLQTGTKLQIRMGFSNNPDELFPIFSGIITQLEEGELITIVAQGFAVELMESEPSDLSYNGYLSLSFLGGVATKLMTGARSIVQGDFAKGAGLVVRGLGKGPAYGGFAVMGDAGNSSSVIAAMLKTSKAVHFGQWQVGSPMEGILKGYGYARIIGDTLKSIGMQSLGNTLVSGADRSDENIFTSHILMYDGKPYESHLRTDFQMEAPFNTMAASYYVPKDPAITPWRIIQDIKRRYPEYIVKVAPYGFPFGIDATLVFSPPNEFYRARLPFLDEAEKNRFSPEDAKYFLQWWHLNWPSFQGLASSTRIEWAEEVLHRMGADLSFTFGSSSSDDNQIAVKKLMTMIETAGSKAPDVFTKILQAGMETAQRYEAAAKTGIETGYGFAGNVLRTIRGAVALQWTKRLEYQAEARNLQKNFDRLLVQAQQAVQQFRARAEGHSTDPRANDRVQPVRKWHLVTYHNIIHNGIQLNGDIYNAVRITDETIACNKGVETYQAHMHVLDVDQLIIDPVNNVTQPNLSKPYAQSFLKEELGKMYRGELVLAGQPEIEPYDIILIYDPATGTAGPIEVESVIHSFDQENGYISIVKPRALVMVNEAFTAGIMHAAKTWWNAATGELSGLVKDFINTDTTDKAVIATGAALTGVGAVIGTKTLLAGGAAVATDAGAAATAAGAGAAVEAVSGAAATVTASLSWPVALTAGAVAAAGGYMVMAAKRQGLNPMFIAPLSRYGRPWVAGVEGWVLQDLHTSWKNSWNTFSTYEIAPTLKGFKDLRGITEEWGL